MSLETLILSAVSGYLIGSLNFARLITRLVSPESDLNDIELPGTGGSENIKLRHYGANTASIKLGPRWGCTIGLMDILKVTIITLVIRLIFVQEPYYLATAVFGLIGHNWPIYYKFKGGGGMSAIYGGFLAADWLGAVICAFIGLLLGMVVVKDVLLAYISGPWLMVLWLWFTTHDLIFVLYGLIVNILFVIALLPEIREQIKNRREGKVDFEAGMQTFPMGRSMMKIIEKLPKKR